MAKKASKSKKAGRKKAAKGKKALTPKIVKRPVKRWELDQRENTPPG